MQFLFNFDTIQSPKSDARCLDLITGWLPWFGKTPVPELESLDLQALKKEKDKEQEDELLSDQSVPPTNITNGHPG